MWQSANKKARTAAKKRERGRNRTPLYLKRVMAEVKLIGKNPNSQIHEVRLVLNDFTPKGLGLFTSQPLMVGQDVAVTLEHPKRIYVRGRVTWCQEHDPSCHVVSSTPFPYRVGILFLFSNEEEEKAIAAFCRELNEEYLSKAIPLAA